MYDKFLIVASKQDLAGMNITNQLPQFRKNPVLSAISQGKRFFDLHIVEGSILETKNLDPEKIDEYDFIIFASKHKSEKNEKALTVHAPGNLKDANYGGESGKVCRASALFQKQLFEMLKKMAKKHGLARNYNVTLEATHHGPLIDKPCVFIEIGSTETEWKYSRAGFVIAKTISETIEKFKENPYNEVAIGIGGPHYCPGFNKLQLKSNVAISHVIPKYLSPISKEMIEEAWEKTEEDPDFAVIDWKGLGNSEERQKVIEILDENHLPWKKLNEIKR